MINRVLSSNSPPAVTDSGLLILRVAAAAVFIAHGFGDVFEAGVSTNVQNYQDAGIPLAALSAPFTAYIQLFGGVLLLFGALTRIVSAGHVIVMLGALYFVHWGEPLAAGPDGAGSGFAFIMCAVALTLLLTGAGRFSADHLISRRVAHTPGVVGARTA